MCCKVVQAANNAFSDPGRPKPKGTIMKQASQSASKDFVDNRADPFQRSLAFPSN